MLLDNTPEYEKIWDEVYEKLKFNPSVKNNVAPFEIEEPYSIYKIDDVTENHVDDFENVLGKIFSDLCKDGQKIYALDWQHSAFLFSPHNKEEQKDCWVEDSRYIGGGYNAYFPPFYPDGDYYFFIEENFKFGYLGHPWRREIWVWGKELIAKIDAKCNSIGLKNTKFY